MVRLNEMQLKRVRNVLKEAFDRDSMADLLSSLNRTYANYAVDGPFPVQLHAIVNSANRELWLFQLVQEASKQIPLDPELGALESDLFTSSLVPLPPGDDPHFSMCCLDGDYIMVNRSYLRTALRAMRQVSGKRILVVRDKDSGSAPVRLGTKTGKSLTTQFLSVLNRTLNSQSVFMDLDSLRISLGLNSRITPVDIARTFAIRLGYGDDILPQVTLDAHWARWSKDFCDRFVLAAETDARQIWLIIDEFNKVELEVETMDLIKQLAFCICQSLPLFRLVLIGYSDVFEPKLHPLVETETLSRALSESEMVDFFVRAAQQRLLTLSEDQIVDAAVETLSGLDPGSENYLAEIGFRARSKLARLAGALP